MSQFATSSGREKAQEFSAVQQVNGLSHQDAESQSTILSRADCRNSAHAPAQLTRPGAFSEIVYASRAMDEIIIKIERSRDCSTAMLITGETGTGKELIARAVYAVSDRHEREFIPFDCGAVLPELIASELFGHQKGAFTNADRNRKGVIRETDGCTLFLDEIGELPLAAQVKFLRFLQEGEVRPLGETKPILEEIGVCDPPPSAAIVEGMFVIDRRLPYREKQKELEKLSIINALNETGGNITRAAAMICRITITAK